MEELFRSYWWMVFPLAWFMGTAFDQLLRYRRHRDTLDLIKTYTEQGKEPPQALMDSVTGKLKLDAADDEEDDDYRSERRRRRYLRRRERSWYSVVLFGVLAAGFAFASVSNIYSASGAFLLVAIVFAALCLASLVGILTSRRD